MTESLNRSRASSSERLSAIKQRQTQDSLARLEEGEKFNLEMGLERVGGFGLFQGLITLFMGFLRNSGIPLTFMLAFLVMPQEYQCFDQATGEYKACDAAVDICPALEQGQPIDYRINEENPQYLLNWHQQMGLICTPI